MAITVTSKYKPFTYDELVKPLGEYWKKYDAQEQALNKSLEDLASLDASISTLDPELEGNKEYIEQVKSYKDSIQSLVDDLTSEGYNSNQRKASTALRQTYNSQIVPISTALVEIKKYAEREREKENAGYVIGAGSTRNLTIGDVIGGNVPESTSMMSLKNLEEEATAITNRITSAMVDYDGANATQIKQGTHKGYTTVIGFDPKLLLTKGFGNNPKVKAAYQGITNQIKKYVLSSLNLIEDEYNALDSATKAKIDAHINQGIIRGVQYSQSATARPTTTTRGNGKGGGSGSTYIQYLPPHIVKKDLEATTGRLMSVLDAYNLALKNKADYKEGQEWTIHAVGGTELSSNAKPDEYIKGLAGQAITTDKKGSIPVVLRRHLGNDKWEDETIYIDFPSLLPNDPFYSFFSNY